eukprot:252129_1
MSVWFCVLFLFNYFNSQQYNVTVIDITTHPIISYVDGNTQFQEIFNPSFIVSSPTVTTPGLIMRTQNCSAKVNGSCVSCSGTGSAASIMTFIECNNITTGQCSATLTNPVSNNSIVFQPTSQLDIKGTEDPRVLYNKLDGYYYMFYTSYGYADASNPKHQTVYLSLARSLKPNIANSWTKYGPIFPANADGSKSGALLIEFDKTMDDFGIGYLYWGAGIIRLTVTDNVTNYVYNISNIYLTKRDNGFDSGLVESGPPPLQLNVKDKNGKANYIFFYNSMTKGFPNAKESGYHPGFVIINKYNKSDIIQRSGLSEPLISPTLSWEQGIYPYTCNVPRVVFLEAAEMFTHQQKMEYIALKKEKDNIYMNEDSDLVRVYFGGADAVIGTAVVQIEYA